MDTLQFVYPIHLLLDSLVVSSVGYYEQNCYQHFCTTLYVDVCFVSFGQMQEAITESYDKGILNLMRNCQAVFQGNCAVLHAHQ